MLARRLLGRVGLDIPEGALTVMAPGIAGDVVLSGGKLSGVARGVPWGRSIRHVVLAAGDTLALADISGATVEPGVNMADEPRDTLDLGRARVIASAPMDGAVRAVEAYGALLRAVQLSGALSRVLEHSLTWTGDRVQFGKPISKFQAIQHLMAQLAAEVAAASAATDMAVGASASAPNRFAVAIAKARAGEAAGKGSAIAHQAFGAMGFTREHQLQYATRRLWSWRDEFGGEAYWQAELGRTIAAKESIGPIPGNLPPPRQRQSGFRRLDLSMSRPGSRQNRRVFPPPPPSVSSSNTSFFSSISPYCPTIEPVPTCLMNWCAWPEAMIPRSRSITGG